MGKHKIDPAELVSVQQVAEEFGYDPKHLSKMAKQGKLVAWRIGNTWATTRALIEEYVKSNPKPGPKPKK